ncbi:hypothetical protein NDU88_000516 [Pleurodeles waltl]|uniref:Uncharacterized protein n=1 Tax=Pleurodeles waltl TaxID=8319 RepID=A0AAV7R8D6_PLEWA|nr:hypothetical protein NDU88_000516 [Pleurodeles waltl]
MVQHRRKCSPLDEASAGEGSAQQAVFTTGRGLSSGRLSIAASVHHWKSSQQGKAQHSSKCSPLDEATAGNGSAQQPVFTTGRGLSSGRLSIAASVHHWKRPQQRKTQHSSQCSPLEEASAGEDSAQQSVSTTGRGLSRGRLSIAASVHHWKRPQQGKAQYSSQSSPLEEASAGEGSAQREVFTTGRRLSRERFTTAASVHHWTGPQQGKTQHSSQCPPLDGASAGEDSA